MPTTRDSDGFTRLVSGSPIVAGLLMAAYGSLGLLGIGFGVRNTWREHAATKWPTAPGVITGSEVRVRCGRTCSHLPDILYIYQVDSERHSSDRVNFGGIMVDWRSPEAEEVVARYPVGASVSVHYDPRNHDEAVLEPGRYLGQLLIGGFGAFFLGLTFYTYRRAMAPAPITRPRSDLLEPDEI